MFLMRQEKRLMEKKVYKPVKRNEKNVLKCLVKENQRIHDYRSPLGVKFWNQILFEAKCIAPNRKPYPKNMRPAIEKHYAYVCRMVNEEQDELKRFIFMRQVWMLGLFMSDEWKYLFTDTGRLYPEKRGILWLDVGQPEWEKGRIYTKEEILNWDRCWTPGDLRYLYPNQSSSWLEPPTEEDKERARQKRLEQQKAKEEVNKKRRAARERYRQRQERERKIEF